VAPQLTAQWQDRLAAEADGYARLALENIAREYPSLVCALMTGPGQFPHQPRDRTPVFFGSFDWHSCVEMHWVLVRLLRTVPAAVPEAEIRAALDAQFTPAKLAAEAEYAKLSGTGSRHYAWGWALTLSHELATWADGDARRWAAAMAPLAEVLTGNFLRWLPKVSYPTRVGVHANSSFALSRALPHARLLAGRGQPELSDTIEDAARRWHADDADYPAGWEPSAHDFLSPALAEAELMAGLLPPGEFSRWLGAFLPGLAGREPAALFTPAVIADSSDGQIAHLHGLNLSRAWCFRRLAESLPPADPRVAACTAAMHTHAEASLPHVVSDHYMVTHWLAAYALLLFTT
jgi:hypothetical protein